MVGEFVWALVHHYFIVERRFQCLSDFIFLEFRLLDLLNDEFMECRTVTAVVRCLNFLFLSATCKRWFEEFIKISFWTKYQNSLQNMAFNVFGDVTI